MNSNRPPALAAAAVLSLLCGCAAAPVQEMSDARQSLQAARSIDAAIHAPSLYGRAEDAMASAERALRHHSYGKAKRDALIAHDAAVSAKRFTQVAHDAQLTLAEADGMGLDDEADAAMLLRAKGLATSEHDAAQAIRLADQARRRLHRLVDAAQRGPADGSVTAAGPAAATGAPSVSLPATPEATRAAPSMDVQQQQPSPTPAASASATDAVTTYTVKPGDTLWRIAARPAIYANAEYWPLIYRANRNRLPSPDRLMAGQKLTIPRDPSPGEIDAAVNYARRRDAWSVVKAQPTDQAYLENAGTR